MKFFNYQEIAGRNDVDNAPPMERWRRLFFAPLHVPVVPARHDSRQIYFNAGLINAPTAAGWAM